MATKNPTAPPSKAKTPRLKRSVITEAQDAYVEGVLDGKSKADAALDAGYTHGTASAKIERSEMVQQALAERRDELSSATQVTRAGVINTILDAIEMARLMSDPTAMLTGCRDIAKMMGYNAPEVKKLEVTSTQGRIRQQMEAMGDEELLRLIDGNTLEGEARVID